MELEFWKPTLAGIIKATVHKNGNLGFSAAASEKLGLDENTYLKVGTNPKDRKDSSLYMIKTAPEDEHGIKVNKSGDYLYLNLKSLFNEKGIDFVKNKIIFDITEIKSGENTVFKFIMRKIERKTNK